MKGKPNIYLGIALAIHFSHINRQTLQCRLKRLQEDKKAFDKMVLDAVQRLHEGNVARYRLKLSEFQAWKTIRDRYGEYHFEKFHELKDFNPKQKTSNSKFAGC